MAAVTCLPRLQAVVWRTWVVRVLGNHHAQANPQIIPSALEKDSDKLGTRVQLDGHLHRNWSSRKTFVAGSECDLPPPHLGSQTTPAVAQG